jgi:hypothetical protein
MFRFSLIGFLVSGFFLGRAYFDYYFAIVACLVVLDRVARDGWARRSAEDDETLPEADEEFLLPAGGANAQRV